MDVLSEKVEAGILFELRYNLTAGHSFLPKDKLIPATAQLLDVAEHDVQTGVERLIEQDRLICHGGNRASA